MNTDLHVLVVDDEATARKRMTRLLSALQGVAVVAECESGERALEVLSELDIDIVTLDIEMGGLSGIETRALMPEDGPYTIIATAHPNHAVKAFEVAANDYLLKPIEASRLKTAIDRAREHLSRPLPTSGKRIPLQTSKGVVLLNPSDVTHATLENRLVTVHAGQSYLVDENLSQIAELMPDLLERVHRRALLNLQHVERLESMPTGGYLAHLRTGARIEVSRQAARKLRRRLGLR